MEFQINDYNYFLIAFFSLYVRNISFPMQIILPLVQFPLYLYHPKLKKKEIHLHFPLIAELFDPATIHILCLL